MCWCIVVWLCCSRFSSTRNRTYEHDDFVYTSCVYGVRIHESVYSNPSHGLESSSCTRTSFVYSDLLCVHGLHWYIQISFVYTDSIRIFRSPSRTWTPFFYSNLFVYTDLNCVLGPNRAFETLLVYSNQFVYSDFIRLHRIFRVFKRCPCVLEPSSARLRMCSWTWFMCYIFRVQSCLWNDLIDVAFAV
jgi:hypothetical protein